ncbi:MAG: amidohydrolase family protein [Candidatus Binatia bacterium]|nr:amidohydrolase family protein [Candidatus Binatia bacterium]
MNAGSEATRCSDIDTLKIVDVDTHISEPLDLWTSRATPKYRDRVPQMKMTDGKRVWTIDGDRSMGVGSAASVVRRDGQKAAGIEFTDWQLDDVHPGCSRTKERLQWMDDNGIWAHVIYPNVLGFAGQGRAPLGAPRREPVEADLRLVSTKIYNEAMAEMQAESGDRLLPMALLPWWDIDLAVQEAERCANMGMRGVNINSDPQLHGMQDLSGDYWTPLWELCCDKELPVNFHIGASDSTMSWYGETPWPSLAPEEKLSVGSGMMFISNAKVISNLITSGLLERFPKLKFVSVESGIGWIPFILETLEYSLAESGASRLDKLSLSPLEYFRRQIYGCFWFETRDVASTIRRLGVDNVMFETDFPHPTCLYPRPLDHAREQLADLTPQERRKVLSTNAAGVYGLAVD